MYLRDIIANGYGHRTKKVKYLDENVGSVFVALTSAEVKQIREAIERIGVHGDRYPPG